MVELFLKANVKTIKVIKSNGEVAEIQNKEKEINWFEIPVDTKVWVKDNEGVIWNSRFFQKVWHDSEGSIFYGAWREGTSSFTAENDEYYDMWDEIKLEDSEYKRLGYEKLGDKVVEYEFGDGEEQITIQLFNGEKVVVNNNQKEKREIDWSKVPVDTKVWVRDNKEDEWMFEKFGYYNPNSKEGYFFATWFDGRDSYTSEGLITWKYARLDESEYERLGDSIFKK